jgi:hypothetical protein
MVIISNLYLYSSSQQGKVTQIVTFYDLGYPNRNSEITLHNR